MHSKIDNNNNYFGIDLYQYARDAMGQFSSFFPTVPLEVNIRRDGCVDIYFDKGCDGTHLATILDILNYNYFIGPNVRVGPYFSLKIRNSIFYERINSTLRDIFKNKNLFKFNDIFIGSNVNIGKCFSLDINYNNSYSPIVEPFYIESNVKIGNDVSIIIDGNVRLDKCVSIGDNSLIETYGSTFFVGRNSKIGKRFTLDTLGFLSEFNSSVFIGRNCNICSDITISGGVLIGEGCVIDIDYSGLDNSLLARDGEYKFKHVRSLPNFIPPKARIDPQSYITDYIYVIVGSPYMATLSEYGISIGCLITRTPDEWRSVNLDELSVTVLGDDYGNISEKNCRHLLNSLCDFWDSIYEWKDEKDWPEYYFVETDFDASDIIGCESYPGINNKFYFTNLSDRNDFVKFISSI